AEGSVVKHVVRVDTGKRAAVVIARRRKGVEHFREAVSTRVAEGTLQFAAIWVHVIQAGPENRDRGADKYNQRWNEDAKRSHLHLVSFDLFAQVLGRAADHQTGDEDRYNREHQHTVESAADAAKDYLTQLHEPHRHKSAQRRV